ncbi:MAG: ethanolamine ammonia-lyase subunit EutC [Propionibacteriaceae bacterium]|jgi:ethanolamine ammonia-lyase small subunit|nr:ethanolamine ammonia-lyase subunit EutC [Propionibacteriaceae bacterium]
MDEQDLESLVRGVLRDLLSRDEPSDGLAPRGASPGVAPAPDRGGPTPDQSEDDPAGLGAADLYADDPQPLPGLAVPADPEGLARLRAATTARIGVGRAGPRLPHRAWLRFRADHAAAMDAVFTDVSPEIIAAAGLTPVQSAAPDKAAFLMDPDLGRAFDAATAALIKQSCRSGAQVQVVVCDGLSSTAVENNVPDLLPALLQGLERHRLSVGTPLFVKYGRVRIMDEVTGLLDPEVTLNLIGERPGLVTNASLSCYLTYRGRPGMAESGRTVLSNIYRDGTPPAEAGAYIADLSLKLIQTKASGLDLKL